MAEDTAGGSKTASPAKSGWVSFDEDAADGGGGGGRVNGETSGTAKGSSPSSPSTGPTSSSGVSSARGSVNSISRSNYDHDQSSPGALQVSEIQVVDEQSLRRKASTTAAAGMTSSRVSASDSMDNVNLEDSSAGAASSTSPSGGGQQAVRGRTFHNGEVIVTLLPVNEKFPWVTPARFRPELVPEELMAPVLTLTVEEYVQTLDKLTTDMRFTVFNILYKRILVIWIATAFTILLCLLFSGFQGVELFACGVAWLVMNAAAIFICMWVKLKLNKQLEKCMSSINSSLMKHKILLGLDDRGRLSCHKVNLCFIYFDPAECIKKLETVLADQTPAATDQNGGVFDRDQYLKEEGFDDVEVVVAGRNSVKLDRKNERAEKLYLHYVQRWAKDYLRRRLDWIVEDFYGRTEYASNTNPRHLRSALCPCQYIEEHLLNKRQRESLNPCLFSGNPCHWCD